MQLLSSLGHIQGSCDLGKKDIKNCKVYLQVKKNKWFARRLATCIITRTGSDYRVDVENGVVIISDELLRLDLKVPLHASQQLLYRHRVLPRQVVRLGNNVVSHKLFFRLSAKN